MQDILIRIGLAFFSGFVIGFERERHGRAAGLRTTILACTASTIAMIVSDSLFAESVTPGINWRPDPARLAAGILAGMGFLGGAAIIRQGNMVRGVTTAATLWLVSILGLAFGSGQILLGLLGLGVALVTLYVLPSIEQGIKTDWYGTVAITLQLDGEHDNQVRECIQKMGITVKRTDLDYDLTQKVKVLRCELRFKKTDLFDLSEQVVQKLTTLKGVLKVQWF